MKEVLAAAKENPELVKIPTVLVQGEDAGGLTGPAAVLGASNIIRWLDRREPVPKAERREARRPRAANASRGPEVEARE
jgi:hypothetical protein